MEEIKLKTIIKYLAFMYVTCCVFASVVVSNGGYDILHWRKPFIVVEVSSATIEGVEENGKLWGYDEFGYYRAFNNGEIGDTVTSAFVYNPFNNYYDDISFRFDF